MPGNAPRRLQPRSQEEADEQLCAAVRRSVGVTPSDSEGTVSAAPAQASASPRKGPAPGAAARYGPPARSATPADDSEWELVDPAAGASSQPVSASTGEPAHRLEWDLRFARL